LLEIWYQNWIPKLEGRKISIVLSVPERARVKEGPLSVLLIFWPFKILP
jgi:hypothetical protein